MLEPLAYGLAVLLSLAILVIGVRFLVVPRTAARDYGVPVEDGATEAYLTVKGVRDASYGIAGIVLLSVAGAHVVAAFLLVATLAPVADTVIVLHHGGSPARAFGIHLATAVVMIADAVLLFGV